MVFILGQLDYLYKVSRLRSCVYCSINQKSSIIPKTVHDIRQSRPEINAFTERPQSTLHNFLLKETYEAMLVTLFSILILRERCWGELSDGYRPTPLSPNRSNLCRRTVQRQLVSTDDDPTAVHPAPLERSQRRPELAEEGNNRSDGGVGWHPCCVAAVRPSWTARGAGRASALDAGSDAVACASVKCGTGSNGVER